MKTLIELTQTGKTTALLRRVAKNENVSVKNIAKLVAHGKVVVPANCLRLIRQPCAIGKTMSVKVNANIGTSTERGDTRKELAKLKTAIEFGADTVMDLSVGGDLKKVRQTLLQHSRVPLGTVPIYEAAHAAIKKYGSFAKMKKDDMLDVISSQAREGVDFFTIHCGVTKKTLRTLQKNPRLMGIVSRGGAIIANWIKKNKKENPLFEHFDRIISIAKQYDITLSLGDGLRPGSVLDATDKAQLDELKLLGSLARRAQNAGVQVMIEGPGHIPIHHIKKNIELQKRFCHQAPFYILGPVVTDIGLGYDHITAAIGSAIAAAYGADFLCFVTPAEHLKLPDVADIKLGVIASRIAAHSGDLARNNTQAWKKDTLMSLARKKRDWNKQIALSIDPQKTKTSRLRSQPRVKDVCTMCGNFCSIKLMENTRRNKV